MKTFVVDSMLGKLATWLRLTGHDAMFSTKIHDDEFLQIAIDTGRVLLTSDEELYHRAVDAGAETMLVRGSRVFDNLFQDDADACQNIGARHPARRWFQKDHHHTAILDLLYR